MVGLAGETDALEGGPASQAVFRHTMDRLAVAATTTDDQALPRLAAEAFAMLRPGTDVVIVASRPVDLADTQRFAALWADPRLREWIGAALVLDASGAEVDSWFEDEPRGTAP
jgi:hypothetical protein